MSELQSSIGCSTVCGRCGDMADGIIQEELQSNSKQRFLPVLQTKTAVV